MNKIEFQKRTSPRFGRDKKLAGIHLMIEKPHPNRSIELRSNPAWTWTHWRNDHVIQQITSINWDWQHNWPHIKDHALQRMFQITCQYNNLQKRTKTIIQNQSTSPLRNKNVEETCMFPCHVSFSPTTHQLWIKLNAEIQKNLTTMIVGNKAPMLKPHLRDLNTQARNPLRNSLEFWTKENWQWWSPRWQGFPLMNISAIRVFSNPAPLFPLKRWTSHRNWCRCQDGQWTTNSWTSTSTFEFGTKKADLIAHIDSSVQKVKKLGHRQHENYNILFQQRHVDEVRTTDRQKQQNFRTRACARVALTLERDDVSQEIPPTTISRDNAPQNQKNLSTLPARMTQLTRHCSHSRDTQTNVPWNISKRDFHRRTPNDVIILTNFEWLHDLANSTNKEVSEICLLLDVSPSHSKKLQKRCSSFWDPGMLPLPRVQPLRRVLVRTRPSWWQSEEPFAKLARTVSVCLSLNTDVARFSTEPQKNKKNAFTQKSNSQIMTKWRKFTDWEWEEILKICLPVEQSDPHKTQTAKDQIFLLLSPTMPWT